MPRQIPPKLSEFISRQRRLIQKRLPDAPGVYFFLGKNKKVLYIGRATSLRSRVRSYFDGRLAQTRGPWTARVLDEAKRIDFRRTDSVLEAILLEADLIKKFQPPYNAIQKDDKSFNCIVITKEEFPRVLLVRKHDLDAGKLKTLNLQLKTIHGPYPHGMQLKEAMKIIRRIFPWRDSKCVPCPWQTGKLHHISSRQPATLTSISGRISQAQGQKECKPCFNRQVGLCPGVCTGEISAEDYRKHIRRLELFLSGKKARIVRELEREMKRAAKTQEFEKASEYKRMLFALKHVQDIALLKRNGDFASVPRSGLASVSRLRIEAYDLSHFGGKEIVGAMTVVEDGNAVPAQYRLFKVRGLRGANEPAGMQEIIRRRLNHPEWTFPQLIVVDGGEIQKRAAEMAVAGAGKSIPVVAVVKDEKHRPREILGFDSEGGVLRINDKGLEISRRDIFLVSSEAHRFVLKFQRKRRRIF
ncbi:MAG: UvrB/UvrC motif-containing protein [bacterium]|nr:UvrB/UvrC motif-containing protein [bacterium]